MKPRPAFALAPALSLAPAVGLALAAALALAPAPVHAGETATATAIPEALAAEAMPHYLRLSPDLAVAGQPSDATLAGLKAMGFRTVVTMRPEAEGPAGEEAIVRARGLEFARIAVKPDTFSSAEVDALATLLDEADARPILLHCSSANRVGGALAVLEVRRGRPVDEAIALGRKWGLSKPEMEEAVRRVIAAEAARATPAAGQTPE